MGWIMIWMLSIADITAIAKVNSIQWSTKQECERALVDIVSKDPNIYVDAICVRNK